MRASILNIALEAQSSRPQGKSSWRRIYMTDTKATPKIPAAPPTKNTSPTYSPRIQGWDLCWLELLVANEMNDLHPKSQHLQHKVIWGNQETESMCSSPLCCNPPESRSIYLWWSIPYQPWCQNDWQASARCSSGQSCCIVVCARLHQIRNTPIRPCPWMFQSEVLSS